MKTPIWFLVATILGLSGCGPAGTGNDPVQKLPSDSVSCEDYSSIMKWQVPPVDPIAVVGHGAMLDSQGREVAATPAFVTETQKYYLKSLYVQAKDPERAEFQKKQQRLCPQQSSITQQDRVVVNAALISWLISAVNPGDSARLASNNAILANGIVVSPTIRERLNAEGRHR
jgi:hypothetical protein